MNVKSHKRPAAGPSPPHKEEEEFSGTKKLKVSVSVSAAAANADLDPETTKCPVDANKYVRLSILSVC
jgi:hypothetical protein